MIESLISPATVEKKPSEAFIAGFIFAFVACILAMGVSSPSGAGSGFLVVAFISIAAAPFFLRIFAIEEKKKKGNIFDRHDEVIRVYAYFFLAVILASSLFYVIIGPARGSTLFSDQIHDLCSKGIITDPICEPGIMATGDATGGIDFTSILTNNLGVLLLAFVFSFMLGAGAVFLISWNATVIGALIAKIAEYPTAFGSIEIIPGNAFVNYISALPFTLLRLLPHGIFEFGGYFFGAVAGGILSVAIIREQKIEKYKFTPVLKDSLIYLAVSVALIFIGTAIEVLLI